MLRKEDYVNMEKYRITKRKQEARWRKRTGSGKYRPKSWTGHDDELVLDHGCPDRELGKKNLYGRCMLFRFVDVG